MKENSFFGWAIVAVLCLIPLVAVGFVNSGFAFNSFSTSMRSLGRLAGLVGVVLFSLSFILNTRLKFLEDTFGGLDKVFRVHHLTGTIAFILLLFHPLFLVSQFLSFSLQSSLNFLVTVSDLARDLGDIALIGMTLILIFTFLIKLRYNVWKKTHQFIGAAFFIAIFHVFLITSDVSTNAFVRVYILSVMAVGLIAYIYRTLLPEFFVKKYEYKISGVKKLGGGINEISLSPKNESLKFKPGQFIFISFHNSISRESHPFTISSAPNKKAIRLSIKTLGDFTSTLGKLKKGDRAVLEGPYGKFSPLGYKDKEQIWIAGGIGITPFLSHVRDSEWIEKKVDFYYSTKEKSELVFLNELKKIKNKNLRIIEHVSNEKGHLGAELVASQSGLENKEIFLCGPPAMMHSLKEGFLKLGVPAKKIHFEDFSLK